MAATVPSIIVKQALTAQKRGFLAAGFTHTLNPYKGCGFGRSGCAFCYVRESPVGKFGPDSWGTWVMPKDNIATVLQCELRKTQASSYRVFMSSATDPYQPLEARWQLSRRCLEVFQASPIAWLVVQTRSLLVQRDFDLLAQLPFATLNISVETDLVPIQQYFSRSSGHPGRRLHLVRQALGQGIATQVTVAPLLPYSAAFADLLAQAVGEHGRIIIDTFLDGDGSGGQRSRRLGMRELLTQAGYPDWFEQCREHAHTLIQYLVSRLGRERVLWSAAGFCQQQMFSAGDPWSIAQRSTL